MTTEWFFLSMFKHRFNSEVGESPEFSSAVLRLAGWTLMASLLGVGGYVGYYQVDWTAYFVLFGLHLAWFLAILVSTFRHPELNEQRTYVGILADLSGTSFSLYLSGDPTSPFYLIYVWSYLSQGMRFGKRNLVLSSLGSVFCFTIVSSILDGWHATSFEIAFIILSLVVLPWYQYVLLRRLHEAKTAAVAANKAKSNFLATITHELRTPLSGVIGMSRLLGSTRLDDEQRDYVESLSSSANMLQALIGDILDLSKIEARKLELKPEPFDIRRSITEVMVALSNAALDKGVDMVIDVAQDVPEEVYGDPLRFRQVLFNLVGNAVKFTEKGRVLVDVRIGEPRDGIWQRHLSIAVKDTGVGIPAGDLDKVFDNFWQADDSSTRSRGGTGLGTAISRDLTRLMKGQIGVESVEGRGTTFWVCLPFLKASLENGDAPAVPAGLEGMSVLLLDTNADSLAVMEQACRAAGMRHVSIHEVDKLSRVMEEQADNLDLAVLADSPRGLDLEGLGMLVEKLAGRALPVVFLHYPRRPLNGAVHDAVSLIKPFVATDLWSAMLRAGVTRKAGVREQSPLLNAVPGGEGARVLVAEDDSINAKLIQSLLEKGGHQVVLVRDGQHALEEALKGDFDLALVDLRMPQMDGMDFTRSYREREDAGHLPIVALTANAAEDARDECLAAGMDDFLTKPVDPVLLDGLLRRYRRAMPA